MQISLCQRPNPGLSTIPYRSTKPANLTAMSFARPSTANVEVNRQGGARKWGNQSRGDRLAANRRLGILIADLITTLVAITALGIVCAQSLTEGSGSLPAMEKALPAEDEHHHDEPDREDGERHDDDLDGEGHGEDGDGHEH
jgi:hypothetical protein